MPAMPAAVAAWHRVVEASDPALLDGVLADEVVFRSPAVFTPQVGKPVTTAYLTAAMTVLGPGLRYLHEWYDDTRAVLEFETTVDGRTVHGVDMLTWDGADRLTEFTVMVRPFKGLQALIERMGGELARLSDAGAASSPPI